MDWMTTYPFSAFINAFTDSTDRGAGQYMQNNIYIGNDVWIGSDVKIFSGVTIGDGCVIGANSVILKNTVIPDYTIWAGVPARQIRKRFSDDIMKQLKEMKWWDWPDENVCTAMPILQSDNIAQLIEYYKNTVQTKIADA
jgi:acetyltransferase-like isoleucine patch superfamily enzyme